MEQRIRSVRNSLANPATIHSHSLHGILSWISISEHCFEKETSKLIFADPCSYRLKTYKYLRAGFSPNHAAMIGNTLSKLRNYTDDFSD